MQDNSCTTKLENQLATSAQNEIEVSDFFQHPALFRFYKMTTHTKAFDGQYGIKKHTQAVVDNFAKFYEASCLSMTSFDPKFVRKILQLHDIGKGISSETKDQYHNTIQVISDTYKKLGLSEEEFVIIKAVILYDPFGKLFKSYNQDRVVIDNLNYKDSATTLKKAYDIITSVKHELNKNQFFNLINIYYCCDAATYPFIRSLGLFDNNLNLKDNYKLIANNLLNEFMHQ